MPITHVLETCAAGSQGWHGMFCETCPMETFKNKNDGSKCKRCPKLTTTGGKLGQTACKCMFFPHCLFLFKSKRTSNNLQKVHSLWHITRNLI